MNILILNWRDVRHPKSGGAELVTLEHAKGWVKAGHNVTWLTASYPGAKDESTVDGVHFIRRCGSLSIYLYTPIYLLTHARRFDVIVDEVHGFPFFSPLFTRRPVVVFIHEIAGEIWDFMFPFPKNIIGKTLEALYFRLYKHRMFWTGAPSTVYELELHGIPRSQCVVIESPLLPAYHRFDRLTVAKEVHPTYLFVSRVVRMKGIEEVIKAFSFISRAQKDAKLWIVGGGEKTYVDELKRMIKEYNVSNQVIFFGQVSDEKKFHLMARAHILLHASVKEGWGLVILEAAHVGTPSVVYNVPGLKDVVKDGETGIVVDNNSPQEMAREAVRLIGDSHRYRSFRKNGKAWVRSLRWAKAIKASLVLLQHEAFT